MTATSKEDESTRLRRENKERLSRATEPDELVRNRALAREHGVTSSRATLVHGVSARLRVMLSQARIGLDIDVKGKARKEPEMKRLPNGFINDPPTWLLEHSPEGWTLRGWPSSHPALPTNKPISSWPTATLYSVLSMLLFGTILLVLPSPSQPDRETIVRAPQQIEPPSKRRRSGSVGAGSTWGSEYGGSDGEADLDAEEREVLGMLEPSRADSFEVAAASPLLSATNASGTVPPTSPRDDTDEATLAASVSPKRNIGKASLKGNMKTKPARTSVSRPLAEEPSDRSLSSASASADESPVTFVSASTTAKHKRSASSATAGEPEAKKHRRSRSGIDPEEKARLLKLKEAEKVAQKVQREAQREADREAKKEAKEAERKARIEQRVLKEAKKEAEELARMEREMRGVEEVKDLSTKRRLSVAPNEADLESRESKRRKIL